MMLMMKFPSEVSKRVKFVIQHFSGDIAVVWASAAADVKFILLKVRPRHFEWIVMLAP